MNFADDMRANKKAAAAAAKSEKEAQMQSAQNFVAALDKLVPEVATALRQARIKKDWKRSMLDRGWRCWAISFGNEKVLVIYPSGRWCFGHTEYYFKTSRRSVLNGSGPFLPHDRVRENLHEWAKGKS